MLVHTGARTLNENDPNYIRNLALVVRVEQQMVSGQQEITASAEAHRDGPTGALVSIDGLRVHVLKPVDFGTQPRKTGGAKITQTVAAPGGKYKTVVAEASITSPDYTNAVASVTVPGDE